MKRRDYAKEAFISLADAREALKTIRSRLLLLQADRREVLAEARDEVDLLRKSIKRIKTGRTRFEGADGMDKAYEAAKALAALAKFAVEETAFDRRPNMSTDR